MFEAVMIKTHLKLAEIRLFALKDTYYRNKFSCKMHNMHAYMTCAWLTVDSLPQAQD